MYTFISIHILKGQNPKINHQNKLDFGNFLVALVETVNFMQK